MTGARAMESPNSLAKEEEAMKGKKEKKPREMKEKELKKILL
jgi:hypothetical protein